MSQHVMNVHQFASSWAARYAAPRMPGGESGDRYKAARKAKSDKAKKAAAGPKSDFSVPKQSELSPKNKQIHDILTRPI